MLDPRKHDASAGIEPAAHTLGPTLRHLREARGLSPSEVTARLKFSQRQLEAIETEQWDRLPAGISLRGFIKNYGRLLEADVDALLTMLDNQVGTTTTRTVPVAAADSRVSAEFSPGAEPVGLPWGWMLIILVLVLIAGFYAIDRGWLPESWLIFDWMKSLNA